MSPQSPTLPRKLKLAELVDLPTYKLSYLAEMPDTDIDTVLWAEKDHLLYDTTNNDARVKWLACFREVVALRCPRNAIGTPVVSDIDLLQASARERLIAFILWKSNHYKPTN